MAGLTELIRETLRSGIEAVEDSERQHLKSQLDILKQFVGRKPTIEDLQSLLEKGWLPDFYAGAKIEISAQLNTQTTREKKFEVGGGVSWGPLHLDSSFSDSYSQAQQTNLSVSVVMIRQSRSSGVESLIGSVGMPTTPPVVATPPNAPVITNPAERPDNA